MGRLGVAAILALVVSQAQPAYAQQLRLGRPTLPPAVVPASEPTLPPPAPRHQPPRLEPPPNILGGDGRNLFRATPGTYRPDPDRLLFPVPYYVPVYPTPFPVPYAPVVPNDARVTPPAQPVAQVHQPAATVPSGRPPHAGPLYVIPRCYAGDRPPRADQLRRGCSVDDMRVITSRGL